MHIYIYGKKQNENLYIYIYRGIDFELPPFSNSMIIRVVLTFLRFSFFFFLFFYFWNLTMMIRVGCGLKAI